MQNLQAMEAMEVAEVVAMATTMVVAMAMTMAERVQNSTNIECSSWESWAVFVYKAMDMASHAASRREDKHDNCHNFVEF